jgi:hypothetical protein
MCGVSHATVGSARDRLAHSPEVRCYEAFKKDWKKLSDDQCATLRSRSNCFPVLIFPSKNIPSTPSTLSTLSIILSSF